jgi:hypothetical protein
MPFVCLKFCQQQSKIEDCSGTWLWLLIRQSASASHETRMPSRARRELLHSLEQPANFTEDQQNLSFNSRYASLTVNLKATQAVFGKTQVLAVDALTCIDHISGQD